MAPTSTNPVQPIHTDLTTYKTIEEFASDNHVSVATVKKRYKEIPGIILVGLDDYLVSPGTRYPFNMRGHRIDNNNDRIFVLLKAINQERYISEKELRTPTYNFQTMLFELSRDGYIELNGYGNNFGANAYKCTKEGREFYAKLESQKRDKRNAQITQLLGWLNSLIDLIKKTATPVTASSSNDE